MDRVAVPLVTAAAEPRAVLPLKKVTVPPGLDCLLETVAVRATAEPLATLVEELATVTVAVEKFDPPQPVRAVMVAMEPTIINTRDFLRRTMGKSRKQERITPPVDSQGLALWMLATLPLRPVVLTVIVEVSPAVMEAGDAVTVKPPGRFVPGVRTMVPANP